MNLAGKSVKTGLFEETWEKFTAQPCDYDITVAIKTVWRIKTLRVSWKITVLGNTYFLYPIEK